MLNTHINLQNTLFHSFLAFRNKIKFFKGYLKNTTLNKSEIILLLKNINIDKLYMDYSSCFKNKDIDTKYQDIIIPPSPIMAKRKYKATDNRSFIIPFKFHVTTVLEEKYENLYEILPPEMVDTIMNFLPEEDKRIIDNNSDINDPYEYGYINQYEIEEDFYPYEEDDYPVEYEYEY